MKIEPGTRFSRALNAVVISLIERGAYKNKASVAAGLGVVKQRLTKLLNGTITAGSKTVAQLCSSLERAEAADLLSAYLLDEVETVTRRAEKTKTLTWGKDPLVIVSKAKS